MFVYVVDDDDYDDVDGGVLLFRDFVELFGIFF